VERVRILVESPALQIHARRILLKLGANLDAVEFSNSSGELALTAWRFNVVKLPMPRPLWFDGRQLPASYANFCIANGLVLAPTFNDPA